MKRILHTMVQVLLCWFLWISCGPTIQAVADEPPVWTYDPSTPDAPCPSMPACGKWREFRRSHPLPYQAFAVREVGTAAIVIVSEPPPDFSREAMVGILKALFQDDLEELNLYRWPTGLDGWLEDVVLRVRISGAARSRALSGQTLESVEGPAEIVERLRLLHQVFYRTGEGFWLDEEEAGEKKEPTITEVKVSAQDLRSWLSDDASLWTPIVPDRGEPKSSGGLYGSKVAGLYEKKGGLIALVVPHGTRLAELPGLFHTFAVASDFVVGAVGIKGGGVVLIARARQVPLTDLPPLRFESFAGFARNRSVYLAQSYERQRIFAGRIENGQYSAWDWAPILLSQQLDDTELGTLLNLADQILKSWSQHGEVDYFGFVEPSPNSFPFGEESASDYFGKKFGTSSLLFNWNTRGFSFVSVGKGNDVLAADRTNALPILYRPGRGMYSEGNSKDGTQEDADAKAKEARNYFASRENRILVRVVQNVLLDQAIQTFLIIGDSQDPPHPGRSDKVSGTLQQEATIWVNRIVGSSDAADVDSRVTTKIKKFLNISGMTPDQFARIVSSPQAVQGDLMRAVNHIRGLEEASDASLVASLKLAEKSEVLFRASCSSVSGTLTEVEKGLNCEWKRTAYQYRAAGFDQADLLSSEADTKFKEAKATEEQVLKERKDLAALEMNYEIAQEVGRSLAAQSDRVDLDAVLAKVLDSAAKSSSARWIRTPSVVLSKNRVEVDSVGGHSIDLKPLRITTTHLDAPVVRTEPGGVHTGEAGGAPEKVLGAPRRGSLLEQMRASAEKGPRPDAWIEIRSRAKSCNCDAIVSQADDGTILFIRTTPPPVERAIMGKSGVVDALLGPPKAQVVRFENFDTSAVDNMARTAALLGDNPRPEIVGELRGRVSDLVEKGRQSEPRLNVVVERTGKAPEILTVAEDGGGSSPWEPIPWKQSRIETANAASWKATFGEFGGGEASRYDAVIVRFGAASSEKGALGIRVLVDPAKRTDALARLKALVARWTGQQPVAPSPWASSIADLRAAIRKQLNPPELQFFDTRNRRKIRVAQANKEELRVKNVRRDS